MFKNEPETKQGSYTKGSTDTVELAVGSDEIDCLGEVTLKLENIELKNSIHVDGLNETLYSVGQICDTDRIIIFKKSEAVIIDQANFSMEKKKNRMCNTEKPKYKTP